MSLFLRWGIIGAASTAVLSPPAAPFSGAALLLYNGEELTLTGGEILASLTGSPAYLKDLPAAQALGDGDMLLIGRGADTLRSDLQHFAA